PLITSVAAAGKLLTVAGVILQLPEPNVLGQVRVTVPEKPFCEEIVMEPLVPVLPTLTTGKGSAWLQTKFPLPVLTVWFWSRIGSTPTVTVAPEEILCCLPARSR